MKESRLLSVKLLIGYRFSMFSRNLVEKVTWLEQFTTILLELD